MKFLDKAKIRVVSGHGGNGMVAWRREKYVDKGGPAGGDGGRGGDIYFVADENMSTLLDFKIKSVYKAQSGENGGIKGMHGACAKDTYIRVPLGTVVRDTKTGKIIADITEAEQTVLIAKGGRGGRGNARFATAQKRAPQFCEPGEPGIERILELELKLIADIGLLGMPNAGKSTYISSVSSARPKIADYPFTTLVPNLGVVKKDDGGSYVVADIPGLIEGASDGAGLGIEFLRHIERTRMLVHVVDVSGVEGRDPYEDYLKINAELKNYSKALSKLKQIIVANKTDMYGADEKFKEFKEKIGRRHKIIAVSAITGKGLDELVKAVYAVLEKLPPVKPLEFEEFNYVKPDRLDYEIFKEGETFVVTGSLVDVLKRNVVLDDMNSLAYLHKVLRDRGIIKELRNMGATDKSTIIIGGEEFEFID